MKKVAIILANGFETLEALTVVDILRRAEVCCHTFALEKSDLDGLDVVSSHKIMVKADKYIGDECINDYDILVIPGGMPGSLNIKNDIRAINLIKDFNKKGKSICAICAAPITLAKAEVIEGKNVTCYPGFEGELGNCNLKEDLVVVDGNIITAKGAGASIPFAFKILEQIHPEKCITIKRAMLLE